MSRIPARRNSGISRFGGYGAGVMPAPYHKRVGERPMSRHFTFVIAVLIEGEKISGGALQDGSWHGYCEDDCKGRFRCLKDKIGMRDVFRLSYIVVGVCLTLTLLPESAAAVPLLTDGGSFVSDSNTGLDWLKLTDPRTLGKSYNTVTGAFGGSLAGWSYASLADVTKLFEDASGDVGLPESGPFGWSNPGIITHDQWVIANYLAGLLGQTGAQTIWLDGSGTGITSDLNGYGGRALASFSWVGNSNNGLGYLVVPFQNLDYPDFATDDGSNRIVSSFLIRTTPDPDPVPEPNSIFLFGSGILLLGAFARACAKSKA